MNLDPDEDDMEDARLNEEGEQHWRVVYRTMMEGWMMRSDSTCYEVGCLNEREKRLLRIGIMWKCQVLMGRRFFGKW